MPIKFIEIRHGQDPEYEGSGMDMSIMPITYEQYLQHLEDIQKPLPRITTTPDSLKGLTTPVTARPEPPELERSPGFRVKTTETRH